MTLLAFRRRKTLASHAYRAMTVPWNDLLISAMLSPYIHCRKSTSIAQVAFLSVGRTERKSCKVALTYRRAHSMQTLSMIGARQSIESERRSSSFTQNLKNCFTFSCRPVDDEDIIGSYPTFVHPNIW